MPLRISVAVVAVLLLAYPALAADKPLKVFILAGQSNMQGHANIATFDSLVDDPKTAPLLKDMRDQDGKPKACDRVWITSVGCQGNAYDDLREQTGKLTVGFGAFGQEGRRIGPEYLFGITMEKRLNEPVLIIKTSWGGRSLHTDFRPPSGGAFEWSEAELAQRKKRGDDIEKLKADKVKSTGVYYREMIAHVKKVLGDIKRVVPDYDPKQGYELAGFVWFQGFNDYVDGGVYPDRMKPGGYDLYADLLAHLIRDVRKDLSSPKLPFVIGVMGIDGLEKGRKPPMANFREAQRKPGTLDWFKGNVFTVETAPFWDDELDSLKQRMDRLSGKLDAEFKKDPKLTREAKEEARKKAAAAEFKEEELKRLKAGVSNGGYHYLGAAKILAPVGKAFAEALLPAGPKP
jgi:Carbohydrate esterase, sialic acid-specific acetylesterase